MGVFESSKLVPAAPPDLYLVAQDLQKHFTAQGFQVEVERTRTGGCHVSLSKGELFQAIIGNKTALNVEIEPAGTSTFVKAGIGLFGLHAIPAAVSTLVFWPIRLTQIWGLVQQSKLDDQAIECAERSLYAHSGEKAPSDRCRGCGARLQPPGKFCAECGKPVR